MEITRFEKPEVKLAFWPWINDKCTLGGCLEYFYSDALAGDRPRAKTTRILAEARLSAAEFNDIAADLTKRRDWLQDFGGTVFEDLPGDIENLDENGFIDFIANLKGQAREDFFDRHLQRVAIRITDGERSFLSDSEGRNHVERCGFEEIPSGGCVMERGDGSPRFGSVLKSLHGEMGVICNIVYNDSGDHEAYSLAVPRSYPRRIRPLVQASEVKSRAGWVVTRDVVPESDVNLLVDCIRRAETERQRQKEEAQEQRKKRIDNLRKAPENKHLNTDPYKVAANIKADLEKAFPGVVFSVRRISYNTVKIVWKDPAVSIAAVQTVTGKYKYTHWQDQTPWQGAFGGVEYIDCEIEK